MTGVGRVIAKGKMRTRSILAFVISIVAFALASCSDGRPEAADAKAEFARLYPSAKLVRIRMSEDEVVARSFAITYSLARNSPTKTIELQYMKNERGVYELNPAPPSRLP